MQLIPGQGVDERDEKTVNGVMCSASGQGSDSGEAEAELSKGMVCWAPFHRKSEVSLG